MDITAFIVVQLLVLDVKLFTNARMLILLRYHVSSAHLSGISLLFSVYYKNMNAVPRVTSSLSRRGFLFQNSSKHLNFMTLYEYYANRGYPHTYAP